MSRTEAESFVDEIERTLGSLITPSLTNASAPPKLFEAYILMLILQAAVKEQAQLTYESINNRSTTQFIFRGGPGYIYSNENDYTHAVITFANKPELEAHINIRVSGKSKVLHECDVAVLDRAEAKTCRAKRVMPRHSALMLAVECKYYASTLELGLGRNFMGLVRDIRHKHSEIHFVTNTTHEPIQTLLVYYAEKWQSEIRPTIPNNVDRLRSLFQEAFKNFKQRK